MLPLINISPQGGDTVISFGQEQLVAGSQPDWRQPSPVRRKS
jgi:hypothetical protein